MGRVVVYLAKERALIGRLLIDLLRTMHGARRRLGGRPHLGGDLEYILLSYTVLIGVVCGRPKNATEIARFVDIPRASVQRKLIDLQREGVIVRKGSKFHMVDDEMAGASMATDDYIEKCLSLIRRTARAV